MKELNSSLYKQLYILLLTIFTLFLFVISSEAGEKAAIKQSQTLESKTEQYLEQIETLLEKKIKNNQNNFWDSLRNKLISFSMAGPMANLSGWTLEMLGDSKTARTSLFFLMPLVRWMSEPFLFPVETQGSPDETHREIQKLFTFTSDLQKQGFSVTLDNVGDDSLSFKDADEYQDYYIAIIKQFKDAAEMDALFLSLKLSALTYDLEIALGSGKEAIAKQDEIKSAIVEMLAAASKIPDRRIFVRIDMEEYRYKSLTLQLFREIVDQNRTIAVDANGHLRLGVVIQAYLRDAATDVRDLAVWAAELGFRVPIRLVKGAYLKHEREVAEKKGIKCPVWNYKPSTDANYKLIAEFMLQNLNVIEPAFATHNIRSQAEVMAIAELHGIDNSHFEFQMLYGMGDTIKDIIVGMGYRLREYVPSGSLVRGLKYAGRRFAELANSDNALARTMRGDFSVIDNKPYFHGVEDRKDGDKVMEIIDEIILVKPNQKQH